MAAFSSALSFARTLGAERRWTVVILKNQDVVSVPAIEKFWASWSKRSGLLSSSDNLLSKISSNTVLLSFPS